MSLPTRTELDAARDRAASIRRQMIALQEELDWRCYRLYGLIDEPLETGDPPEIALGERAFEIVLAPSIAAGEETTWFARHGSTPITEVPAHWAEDYRRLVERRIRLIESDRNIGLIERPEYKRRWNAAPWQELEQAAPRSWLLDRLETGRYWPGGVGWVSPKGVTQQSGAEMLGYGAARLTQRTLISVNRLADLARTDTDFMQIAKLYTGRGDFDAAVLVAQLVESESVPFLPVLRYKESGLRKRAEWESCWKKQRCEDAIDAAVQAKFQVNPSLDEGEGRNPGNQAPKPWIPLRYIQATDWTLNIAGVARTMRNSPPTRRVTAPRVKPCRPKTRICAPRSPPSRNAARRPRWATYRCRRSTGPPTSSPIASGGSVEAWMSPRSGS